MLKIIISPAKKMILWDEDPCKLTTPVFWKEAGYLLKLLKGKSLSQLQALWQCSERLALENYELLHQADLSCNLTPALLAYKGIQYQYMAPAVFSEVQWRYVQQRLRILSGFYGILTPTDGVVPYRLEMQARLNTASFKGLYDYWGDSLYEELVKGGTTDIVNLASAEYSRAVLPYLSSKIRCVTCVFGEMVKGKIKVKATQAKMARGEMVRWMAENQITSPQELCSFHSLDYCFHPELSGKDTFVFLKEPS